MWVYQISEQIYDNDGDVVYVYTVGFYEPNGTWHTDSDWNSKEKASRRVHYLNGGKEAKNND